MSVVNWGLYRDGSRVDVASYAEAVRQAEQRGGFAWIGLHDPDAAQLQQLVDDFGLPALAVEDAGHMHERPKIEHHNGTLFAVLKTIRYVPHTELTTTSRIFDTGQVTVFLGTQYVITVRLGDHGELEPLRAQLENDPELLALGPSAVLYAISDSIVDHYLEVTDQVESDIEVIEEAVFATTGGRNSQRIYRVKRELLGLRRAVVPLGQPLRDLAQQPIELIDPKVRVYFRDVLDHQVRAQDLLIGYDEIISSILQANLAQLSVAQNEDMRKITSWAAIIAVPTAVAGIYGMNFRHMPELDWTLGYPLTLLVMLLSCIALYVNFKKRGWL